MYKPAPKMENVEPVGNYAIRIHWNDGHSSGIYSYDHLRQICPCASASAIGRHAIVPLLLYSV